MDKLLKIKRWLIDFKCLLKNTPTIVDVQNVIREPPHNPPPPPRKLIAMTIEVHV